MMLSAGREERLYVIGISEQRIDPSCVRLEFHTTRGEFRALYHSSPSCDSGMILVAGSQAEIKGPACIYPDLARDLLEEDIATLILSCRSPRNCRQCVIDALLALQYLDDEAIHNVVIAGWAHGAVTAISAASCAKQIRGVAAISPFNVPEQCLKRLSSKSFLLIHGEKDTVTSAAVSKRIYAQTSGDRELILYSDAGHDLAEEREMLLSDLQDWISRTLKHSEAPREAHEHLFLHT